MSTERSIVVIGGGITGLSAAWYAISRATAPVSVTVIEESSSTGGLIRTSPFAGLAAVDEGADAFLTRVPWALALAKEVGLGDEIVAPQPVHANVWHNGLQPIPSDVVMGVPAGLGSLAMGRLFSWRGKLRAALEPLLPPSRPHNDSIGALIRARFGNEVQDRLIDPLVGSIYAADTDHFSLASVPQIAALADSRSLFIAAQKARKSAKSASTAGGAIFGVPQRGMGALTSAVADKFLAAGGRIKTDTRAIAVERVGAGYDISTNHGNHTADSVILATPAHATALFTRTLSSDLSDALKKWDHASVIMVTIAVPRDQWPSTLTGSGYLVPKPDQRWVTAASFGSNKWAHWKPADGSVVLRVSLGRDGMEDVMDFDDDTIVNLTLADLKHHLDVDIDPLSVRISRWSKSFPQYRPGHFERLAAIENDLHERAPGVFLTGASYRGIGIPACVQQGEKAAQSAIAHCESLQQ